MAAPTKYPSAHEQLLVLAREARAQGLPFEVFWERAIRPKKRPITWAMPAESRPIGCVVWSRDTADRALSRSVTMETRHAWERAYKGVEPTSNERALRALAGFLDAVGWPEHHVPYEPETDALPEGAPVGLAA